MNTQVFLVIAILFIVMIIVDFVFNFTGILKENFDVFNNETFLRAVEENNANNNNEELNNTPPVDTTLTNKIHTVISHSTGSIYGVIPLGERLPTRKVVFLLKNNVSLSLDKEGVIVKKLANKFDQNQHFRLVRIDSAENLGSIIKERLYSIPDKDSFPYYFLQSVKNPDLVITQLSEGEITIEPITNSIEQRFDVSHEELLNVIEDESKKDKTLKIKLKLDENSLNKILDKLETIGLESDINNNTNSDFQDFDTFNNVSANNMDGNYAEEHCKIEDYIPRDALSSLCYNCDV